MKFREALEVVLDLAQENVIDPREGDEYQSHYEQQTQALDVVADYFTKSPADPTKTFFRFVVCVDIPAASLGQSYDILLDRMDGNDWESTDEAYDPGGCPIDPDRLQAVTEKILEARQKRLKS